jgi:hypothetical protein
LQIPLNVANMADLFHWVDMNVHPISRQNGPAITRAGATISAKIWLVVALCLVVGGSAIAVLVFELEATSTRYEATLRDLQERSRQQDAARILQVTFKKQVQEWKDTLLRGYNPEDLAKYSGQFRADADAVAQTGTASIHHGRRGAQYH